MRGKHGKASILIFLLLLTRDEDWCDLDLSSTLELVFYMSLVQVIEALLVYHIPEETL